MCANFAHVLCSSNSPSLNTLRMCLEIDLNLSFLKIIASFTCVCAFFVVSLRTKYRIMDRIHDSINEKGK